MINDLPDTFVSGFSISFYLICVIGIAIIGVITSIIAIPSLRKIVLPAFRETFLADFIAMKKILDDGITIQCESNIFARVIEIGGMSQTFLSLEEQEKFYLLRKGWLDAMGDLPVDIRCFTYRELNSIYPKRKHKNEILQEISSKWYDNFGKSFVNKHYILLSTQKGKDTLKHLDEAGNITTSMLSGYNPKILNQISGRLLYMLSKITSPISRPAPEGKGEGLAESICTDRIAFLTGGVVEFSHGDTKKYMATYGIRKLSSHTSTEFIDGILSLPTELVLFQNMYVYDKMAAMSTLSYQGKLSLDMASSKARVAEQFNLAIERVEGFGNNQARLCDYSMVLFNYAETIDELKVNERLIEKTIREFGFAPVREGEGMAEVAFFSQIPGAPITRSRKLFSDNVATSVTFASDPAGLKTSQWLDEPITIFKTAFGAPYNFQFHISNETGEDTGHGVAFGRTGSGKTTILSFLAGQALRNEKLKVFYFDRYEGTYVFSKSIGGRYIYFDGDMANCQLNPFQLEATPQNKEFLKLWIKIIADIDTPEAIEDIADLVENALDPSIKKENRKLVHLIEGLNPNGDLYKKLKQWADPEQYGNYFNADIDSLSLSDNSWVSFDFTNLLSNQLLAKAVIPYVMYRIQQTITTEGNPSLIIIDETAPLLQNELMKKWFFTMLQEFRKLDAAVYSCFQRPEAIAELGITQLIRGQAPTRLFFPDPQAKPEDYKAFNFTDTEIECLTGESPIVCKINRPLLLQKGEETVLLQADLSPLKEFLKLFSGQKAAREVKKLQAKHQSDWINYYMEAA